MDRFGEFGVGVNNWGILVVAQTCHSPMSENDRGYVETQNQFVFLGALPISDTRKVEYSAFNAVTFNWHRLIGASGAAHCFQARIKGSFLEMVAVSPLGTPTMIGATALNSAGMPSFAFPPECSALQQKSR